MTGKQTWLTPASEAWERVMGKGTFPFGQGAKLLKPLLAAGHLPETVGEHLAAYLAQNDPRFTSLARFAQTFAAWAPKKLSLPLVDDDGVLR